MTLPKGESKPDVQPPVIEIACLLCISKIPVMVSSSAISRASG